MNMVRTVHGPNGEFAGIVSATLSPDELTRMLESVRYAPDTWAALAHGDGKLLPDCPTARGAAGDRVASLAPCSCAAKKKAAKRPTS